MKYFLSLLVIVFLASCAGNPERNSPANAAAPADSIMGFGQMEPAERQAILSADQEIANSCAHGKAEGDIERGAYVAFDECATGVYRKYLFPVTAYRDEFSAYRDAGRDAAQQYAQGDITFTRLQEIKNTAWARYLAERQAKPLSSSQRFLMEDAPSRARFENVVHGTPGLASPRCGQYGC